MNFVVIRIADKADDNQLWKHVVCNIIGDAFEVGRNLKLAVNQIIDVAIHQGDFRWASAGMITVREVGQWDKAEVVAAWKANNMKAEYLEPAKSVDPPADPPKLADPLSKELKDFDPFNSADPLVEQKSVDSLGPDITATSMDQIQGPGEDKKEAA